MDKEKRAPAILIIDDEELLCKTLTTIIRNKGFRVKSTALGREGLSLLGEGFDVVILDIKLPDISGIEVLKTIKKIHPEISVIMITAYTTVEITVSVINEKAFAFFSKPFEVDALLKAIDDALTEKQAQEKKERQFKNLSLIYRISKEMEGMIELHSIAFLAAQYFCEVTKRDTCAVLLFDAEEKEFFFGALHGVDDENKKINKKRFKLNAQMYERLIINKNAILIPEMKSSPDILQYIPVEKPKALFIFPLVTDERVVGLAVFPGREKFILTDEELETITAMSFEVALYLDNANRYLHLKKSYLDTVSRLVNAIENKNAAGKGDSEEVSELAVAVAEKLNLPEKMVEMVKFAGLLHDVGKIAISEQILLKKEQLTYDEHEKLKMHSIIATRIISHMDIDQQLVSMILYHHERYDGSGYPEGLLGERIPVGARIIAVCDAYKAMISERPYRKKLDKKEALKELIRCSGSQFDPVIIKVFFELLPEE
ncbi:MAG: response regulator [Candidatus Omnitrophica bacterium]|nr:response regulator [Candidatus Omnitrophota bacterium]MBU4479281.1 response regulator [Candidatus Omnitrophota bacterium]